MLAEEAGISRGLLYHYFGNKQDFHLAVVRRAADELIEITAPVRRGGRRWSGWRCSLDAYVDYVSANFAGLHLAGPRRRRAATRTLQEIYEEARAALTDRIFDVAGQ